MFMLSYLTITQFSTLVKEISNITWLHLLLMILGLAVPERDLRSTEQLTFTDKTYLLHAALGTGHSSGSEVQLSALGSSFTR